MKECNSFVGKRVAVIDFTSTLFIKEGICLHLQIGLILFRIYVTKLNLFQFPE